jgi:hypothetical protein
MIEYAKIPDITIPDSRIQANVAPGSHGKPVSSLLPQACGPRIKNVWLPVDFVAGNAVSEPQIRAGGA